MSRKKFKNNMKNSFNDIIIKECNFLIFNTVSKIIWESTSIQIHYRMNLLIIEKLWNEDGGIRIFYDENNNYSRIKL